jgi:AcrR family transcriptional regulator
METRRRVLDAAMAEFVQHGVEGARINRIAERARASKERIYAWFGDKDALFDAVMQVGLEELGRAVPITPDLVDYTVRLHDTFAARPDLQRIAMWAWLHERGRGERVSEERVAGYRRKVQVIRDAQRAGTVDPDWPPHHLLAALIALATSWLAAPVELHRAMGARPDAADLARAQVRRAAQRLIAPTGSGRTTAEPNQKV